MSLGQFWTTIRAAWLTIVLMVVVATSITYVLARQEPKQYTAKARVMLNIDNDDPNQYSALKRGMAGPYIGSEMHIVTDDAVMRAVVGKLGWAENPQVEEAWETQTGGVGDITTWAGHEISQSVNVTQLEDSSILEIYYTSTSLDAAKAIVALIRTAFIDESRRLRADSARRAAAWNRTQAARALATLQAAEAARAGFVRDHQIAVDTPTGGLDYQAQRLTLDLASDPSPGGSAALATNPTADTLSRKLNTLDAEIAVFKLRGEANPTTVALEAERAATAEQLARERTVMQRGPDASLGQIGLVRESRDNAYLAARLNLLDRSPLYDRLAMMDRDIVLKTTRYNAAAARVGSFDSIAAAPSGLNVIGDVIASPDPTFPNIPLMLGIAAGATLALAIAFAVLAELSERQVRGVEDLRFFTGAPVLAVIADDPPHRRLASLARTIATLGRWRPRSRPALTTAPGR